MRLLLETSGVNMGTSLWCIKTVFYNFFYSFLRQCILQTVLFYSAVQEVGQHMLGLTSTTGDTPAEQRATAGCLSDAWVDQLRQWVPAHL